MAPWSVLLLVLVQSEHPDVVETDEILLSARSSTDMAARRRRRRWSLFSCRVVARCLGEEDEAKSSAKEEDDD